MKNENLEKYLKDIDNLGYEKCITLNSLEVSKILGIGIRTLNNWRNQNIGPTSKRVEKLISTQKEI